MLWIHDLSVKDPYYVTPILMGATMYLSQKMTPTTTTDPMQQKMMNYMTIFFGFLFWHQPAGLCLYFIASSLWGIMERKLLDYGKQPEPAEQPIVEVREPEDSGSGGGKNRRRSRTRPAARPEEPEAKKMPGFLQRIVDAANEANQSATQTTARRDRPASRKGRRR